MIRRAVHDMHKILFLMIEEENMHLFEKRHQVQKNVQCAHVPLGPGGKWLGWLVRSPKVTPLRSSL